MGGLALKNTETRRCSREQFDEYSKELLDILRNTFARVEIPLFYRNKESFGDIDILVSTEIIAKIGGGIHMEQYIKACFNPNEIFHNGNAWSFDYKSVQIDLILVAPEHFDSNFHYLSWNDLGNMMGRIAQRIGLKYGQEGLWYNHFYNDQKIGKIMISKDHEKIFKFLGFDYSKWKEGFDDIEDIFEYVATSPFFSADMFELRHLNKINRERNAKRKSYMSFLDYIRENHSHREFEFEDKKTYVKRANKFFPEARMTENMRRLEYLEVKKLYIKSKFGGGEVMRRYGLKGKDLGSALSGFKNWISEKVDSYEDFILDTPTEEIYKHFETYYKETLI